MTYHSAGLSGPERCESFKREGRRSWRCKLPIGHAGPHISFSGGRRWS